MVERLDDELQDQLQAYLNCVELCSALHRHTRDRHMRKALGVLVSDPQDSLAALSAQLRRRGIAPGAREADQATLTRIRQVLAMRHLDDQMRVIQDCLAALAAWYDRCLPLFEVDGTAPDWLASLAEEARRMLAGWERHMREMHVPGV
jgi:hypothetical protein